MSSSFATVPARRPAPRQPPAHASGRHHAAPAPARCPQPYPEPFADLPPIVEGRPVNYSSSILYLKTHHLERNEIIPLVEDVLQQTEEVLGRELEKVMTIDAEGNHVQLMYILTVIMTQNNEPLGFSNLFIPDREAFNVIAGYNPDGSSRKKTVKNPAWSSNPIISSASVEALTFELGKMNWADLDETDVPQVPEYIEIIEPPLVKFADIEIDVVPIDKYTMSDSYEDYLHFITMKKAVKEFKNRGVFRPVVDSDEFREVLNKIKDEEKDNVPEKLPIIVEVMSCSVPPAFIPNMLTARLDFNVDPRHVPHFLAEVGARIHPFVTNRQNKFYPQINLRGNFMTIEFDPCSRYDSEFVLSMSKFVPLAYGSQITLERSRKPR